MAWIIPLSMGIRTAPAQHAPNSVARDWSRQPAIAQIDTREDIFAIGNVHGDYDRLVKLLRAAGLVETSADTRNVTWKAGRAVLVFTGDLIDKGPHSVKVVKLAASLQAAAAVSGGHVVALMGNHEAEFLANPTNKKVKDFAQDLRDSGLTPQDVAACGGEVGHFLCSMPFGARVRDWFFSHGGDTGGRTIPQLTADFESGVGKDGFGSQQLVGQDSLLEARLGEEGPGGHSWFDVGRPQVSAEQLLSRYAAALGVAHLVQGHQHKAVLFDDGQQRKLGQMFQWRGLLFLIDVGMSEGVGDSQGAVLRIHAGGAKDGNAVEAIAICPDGTSTSIWKSEPGKVTSGSSRCVHP
jgi:hypothetical protein